MVLHKKSTKPVSNKLKPEADVKVPAKRFNIGLFALREPADNAVVLVITLISIYNIAMWTFDEFNPSSVKFNVWLAVLGFIGGCQLTFMVATIVHNTIHTRVFIRPKMNEIFHVWLSLLFGHPVSTFVSGHNLSHHRYTQLQKDFMRTTVMRYKWNLINLLMFFPTVSSIVAGNDMRYMRLMKRQKRYIWTEFTQQSVILILVQIILMIFDWKRWLLYWYIPRIYGSVAITSINFLQHDGCHVVIPGVNDSECEKMKLNTARNFTGWITNTLYFNNGLHTAHHAHPILHWSKLPAVHAAEVEPNNHPSLNQKNMFTYIFKTFVYPGKRIMYDGSPFKLLPIDFAEKEEWVTFSPECKDIATSHPSWIVKDVLEDVFDGFVLLFAKVIMPGWSLTEES